VKPFKNVFLIQFIKDAIRFGVAIIAAWITGKYWGKPGNEFWLGCLDALAIFLILTVIMELRSAKSGG